MSEIGAKWTVKGIGLAGLAATASAVAVPGMQPFAVALGLSTAACALLASSIVASRLTTKYPLDRPAPRGARPGPADGAIVLGRGPQGEVRASMRRLGGGLTVMGPDAARRAFLADISRQAAEAGIGHAVVSCSANDGLVERVTADGAGNPWTLTILDIDAPDASATHALAPFAGLSSRAVIRAITAANPALRRDGASAVQARSLLQAVVPILCNLEDERIMDTLSPRILADNLEFRRVVCMGDAEAYPHMPSDLRSGLRSYLASLPAYQEEKKFKQATATLELHAAAAAMIEEGMRWAFGSGAPACLRGVTDALASDLAAPGARTVIRAGGNPDDAHALRGLVASLTESLRARPRGTDASMPFLVIVDRLSDFPEDVADAIRGMERLGAAIVCGEVDASQAGKSGLKLALPGADSVTPASLTTERRSIALTSVPNPPVGRSKPLRRRIPLTQPSREDVENASRLLVTLARLIDAKGPEEAEARAGEMVEALERKATFGDPIAIIARYLADDPHKDTKVAACASVWLAAEADLAANPRTQRVSDALTPPPRPAPAAPRGPSNADFIMDFDDILEPMPEPERPPPTSRPTVGGTAIVVPATSARDPYLSDTIWKNLAGKELPQVSLDDHEAARETLLTEFPYLADIINRIVNDAAKGSHIRMRPLLFNGPTGAGKSRLARRIGDVFGLRTLSYNCGGVSDSSFGGTSRQWSSARPSVALQHVGRTRVANPAILLDEVEKVGSGKHNGNLGDLMLGLTERETASRSFDLYLETEVDLSHVTWFATANSTEGLHPAFRDRFRIVNVPCPGIEHADALIPLFVKSVNEERGLDGEWGFVPSQAETDMIAELWGGGSVRKLRRVVEKVMDTIDGMDKRLLH